MEGDVLSTQAAAPTIDHIRAAARAIQGQVERTPTRHSDTLSRITGADVHLKFENLQYTASFKERGALNKLQSLTDDEKKRGVAAMSAGNHAQGVAYHGGRLGIPVTIVMPEGTPFTKVKHTKDFGARVLLEGATLSESAARAHELAKAEGLTFVHPYDDPAIIAGQGTVALEMLADAEEPLDTLVVPIGGGGLISGVSIAAKAINPNIRIYGVQTRAYPAMYDAVKQANLPSAGQTIAEGIAVKEPGLLTREIVRANVSDILLVDEAQIEDALAALLEIEKTVVEGAAAAAFAAVRANAELFAGRKVGIVLSGGNIDMRLLSNVILRDLSREGRILSLEVEIEDRPGLLARIATLVGDAGGNILEVNHNRMMTDTPVKSAYLSMVVEARDSEHAAEIRKALTDAGFTLRG
ncbi:MAG: threonine ammonia-lyase [Alphaproteobacteria bacterium]|nr:threonine ammonia-lyase [Alphaproteobacteria bacterium]MBV9905687.1 threonine ammonia-lyase [Alphaproteobacteria bacterium]